MKKKVFTEGQAVEFQREPGVYTKWEAGTYRFSGDEWKGWHCVHDASGLPVWVPSRRLRAAPPGGQSAV